MHMPKSPCYGCTDRHATRHTECRKYTVFRDLVDDYRAAADRERERTKAYGDYVSRRIAKKERIKIMRRKKR